ncbi:unnamed protein product [Rhizoctonia solani]|uniref:rRNA biogenesis protein RRP36 n=1 Tax=Rhizoctonia solani TaxID=456999 RepID=A0A8H3BXJ6_9AGAM|nr:unnamed protein product [Rhizoctonia solani]
MPRRPRPATRAPPKRSREEEEEEDEREDRPRFSQWVPEDELDVESDAESDSNQDISDQEHDSDSEASQNSDSDSDSSSEPETTSSKAKPKPEWTTAKRKKDISKRSSKHAPTEVTSKRPVSRHRVAVDVPVMASPATRDPRFAPLSGQLSQPEYSRAYSFISDLQKNEAETLRASLAKARKQRAPWETIESLERALRRAESGVEKAKRDEREREALEKARKEEKEKQKAGKGACHLIICTAEKRELLLKAKFDDLAASGGQNAVRKAIDKRKKKITQKEKKARPFSKAQARAFSQTGGSGSDNRPSTSGSGHDKKRRRIH